MKKKLVTVLMAAAMVVASTLSAFSGTTTLNSKETVSSTAWWTFTGVTSNVTWDGEDDLVFTIVADELDDYGYGAFNAEIFDSNGYYLTVGSDINSWLSAGTPGTYITGNATTLGYALTKGNTYSFTFSKEDDAISVTFKNVTDDVVVTTFVYADTEFDSVLSAHFIAQVGTYTVSVATVEAKTTTVEDPSATFDDTTETEEVIDVTDAADPEVANTTEEVVEVTEASNPESGDASMVIPFAVIALGAAGAAVAMKKRKVTE